MPHKVLVCDRFAIDTLARLKSSPNLEVNLCLKPRIPSAEELAQTQALIIRSGTQITAELLDLAPQLKLVVTCTSGFDHIDLNATQAKHITCAYTPDANIYSTAELTLSLMLACQRKLIQAHKTVKNGDWRRDSFVGQELHGKVLGIIGLGRIGAQVALFAHAFGMELLAFDPFIDEERFQKFHCQRTSIEELLIRSDIVTLHVPLTRETYHLLNRGSLENIAPNCVVINCSRGQVISEEAIVDCLVKGKIAALGLDVYEKEPLPRNSKLLQLDNVVLTPHMGALTGEAFTRASEMAADKVIDFFANGSCSDTLPPQARWYHETFYYKGD